MPTKGKHPYENAPPQQERYLHGTDDWNLETTALPLLSPKTSTMDNSEAMSNAAKLQFPSMDLEHDSPNLFKSTSNGRIRR